MTQGSICIQCGSTKRHFRHKCAACGFVPTTREEKGKSMILSLNYQIDEDYRALSWGELETVGRGIAGGKPFDFAPAEVEEVARYVSKVEGISGARLLMEVAWWLLPLLLGFGFIVYLQLK